jgi:hypothetical protein
MAAKAVVKGVKKIFINGKWVKRNKMVAPKHLCPFSGNCSKGDILSATKPYEVVSSCDKWPKECIGGNYRCGGK